MCFFLCHAQSQQHFAFGVEWLLLHWMWGWQRLGAHDSFSWQRLEWSVPFSSYQTLTTCFLLFSHQNAAVVETGDHGSFWIVDSQCNLQHVVNPYKKRDSHWAVVAACCARVGGVAITVPMHGHAGLDSWEGTSKYNMRSLSINCWTLGCLKCCKHVRLKVEHVWKGLNRCSHSRTCIYLCIYTWSSGADGYSAKYYLGSKDCHCSENQLNCRMFLHRYYAYAAGVCGLVPLSALGASFEWWLMQVAEMDWPSQAGPLHGLANQAWMSVISTSPIASLQLPASIVHFTSEMHWLWRK